MTGSKAPSETQPRACDVGGNGSSYANLAWILQPGWFGLADAGVASRLSFLSVAVWWFVFAIPLFRHVPEPPVTTARLNGVNPVVQSLRQLAGTLRELRQYKQAFLMLVAFLIYNDGIGTIIRMAGPYGQEIGLPQESLILAFVMVQFSFTAYSPRLVSWLAGSAIMNHSLGIFTGTFIYALGALAWVDRGGSGRVPLLTVWVAILLMVVSVVFFVMLVERVGMLQISRAMLHRKRIEYHATRNRLRR